MENNKPIKQKTLKTEKAKEILEKRGYYCSNLWNIKDVQNRFYCTDEEAHKILKLALTGRVITKHILDAVEHHAKENNLKPKY